MEIGAHVWVRSNSSQWGWVPAIISDKQPITNTSGVKIVRLTLKNDPIDSQTYRASRSPADIAPAPDRKSKILNGPGIAFDEGVSPKRNRAVGKKPPEKKDDGIFRKSNDMDVSMSMAPSASSVWQSRGSTAASRRLYTASFDDNDGEPFEVSIDVDPEQLKTADHVDIKLRNLPNQSNSTTPSNLSKLQQGGEGDDLDVIAPDDLITLTHLHEPAILHSLRGRYDQDIIYTSTGPILIAINPFKPMPLYSEEIMEQYRFQGERSTGHLLSSSSSSSPTRNWVDGKSSMSAMRLPPHAYQVADDAYRAMMRGLENGIIMMQRQNQQRRTRRSVMQQASMMSPSSQSVLVSGESGAGKTVTTKIVLNYLAVLSKKQEGITPTKKVIRRAPGAGRTIEGQDEDEDVTIEQQVLQSNPILEAFGNARTIRNDNSSRFGKYIDVHFTSGGKLTGAAIETYLLEKVRLLRPGSGERNYHVFYQLLASATEQERQQFLLDSRSVNDFLLLSHSGTFDRRDRVSDEDNHLEMLDAMITIGFSAETIQNLMKLVVAVLFLGNMTFFPINHGESSILKDEFNSESAATLLGVSYEQLAASLTTKNVLAGNETVQVSLNPLQAGKANEALIKALYGAVFDFIVKRINESIRDDRPDLSGQAPYGAAHSSQTAAAAAIGVLDIFGFETFETNNFEQLCINYTNEALQQQFNKYVFKLEQQEYEREGIMWKFISFPDNQDVLDLIDMKHTGILALLDEQCIVPQGSDVKFCAYLYSKCAPHNRFSASAPQMRDLKFSVEHYAGPVEYSVDSWLEKNKDQLPLACMGLLSSSSFELLADIKGFVRTEDRMGRGTVATKSIGAQFSSQLKSLRSRIDATVPHYIRCLKPNDDLVPHCFEPKNIVEQLRCGGVLEAVRVSRAGYPTRYPHEVFLARYFNLGEKDCSLKDLVSEIALSVWEAEHSLILSMKETEVALTASRKMSKIDLRRSGKTASNKHMFSPPREQAKKVIQERQMTCDGVTQPQTKEDFLALDFSSRCALAGIQMGKTKVFLRREAFDRIEALRSNKISGAAAIIQARVRSKSTRRFFLKLKVAAVTAQTFARMLIAKHLVSTMKMTDAIVRIQSMWRMARAKFSVYKCFIAMRIAVCTIQRNYRAFKLREYESLYHDADEEIEEETDNLTPLRTDKKKEVGPVDGLANDLVMQESAPPKPNRVRKPPTPQSKEREKVKFSPSRIDPEVKSWKNELYKFVEDENWAQVESILDKRPELAEEEDPSSGELPLHMIARHRETWTLLIDTILLLNPKGLLHRDRMGALPIHHAAAHDSLPALEIIYNAYKEGINEVDFKGRLPLHVAAEFDGVEAVKYLLEKSPEGAYTMVHRPPATTGGGLPLHVACRNLASIGIITALLAENFGSAKRADENGDLPLHLLLRCGEDVDQVMVKTILTCFAAAISRTDMTGALPLAIALKHRCNAAVVNSLLVQYPDAAGIPDGNGQTPLFLALQHDADDRVILSLLNHAPQWVTNKDKMTGLLPIQIATKQRHSGLVVHNLLKYDLPIDVKEKVRAQLRPHNYSWNHIVSDTEDLYYQVMSKLLQQCTQPQVLALAHVEGPDGKIALASATPVCKHELRVMLRLFNTLEVVNQRPAYRNPASDTQIFYALRYDPPENQSSTAFTVLHEEKRDRATGDDVEDLDDASQNSDQQTVRSFMSHRTQHTQHTVEDKLRQIRKEKGQQVIAKLTSRSEVVERELSVRKNCNLSRNYVPAVLAVHHTVQHAAYSEAMAEPGYCITMEGADTTAENMMLDYRKKGQAFPIKALKRIGIALLHLHEHGLIHGDFGTHNIGKFKSRWKLLGVGGSVTINGNTDPTRGFYHPPEAVDSPPKGSALVASVRAQCTYDIWAFGVVVYEAVAGTPLPPYARRGKNGSNAADLAKVAKWDDGALIKAVRQIGGRDENAVDLLKQLLQANPKQRLRTMRAVLSHPFFERRGEESSRRSTSTALPAQYRTNEGSVALSSSLPSHTQVPSVSTLSSLGRSSSASSASSGQVRTLGETGRASSGSFLRGSFPSVTGSPQRGSFPASPKNLQRGSFPAASPPLSRGSFPAAGAPLSRGSLSSSSKNNENVINGSERGSFDGDETGKPGKAPTRRSKFGFRGSLFKKEKK